MVMLLVQFVELFDVQLYMLGSHQLQNAVTATCAVLCLRNLGESSIMFLCLCWYLIERVSHICFTLCKLST